MANHKIQLEPKPQNLATKPKRGIENISVSIDVFEKKILELKQKTELMINTAKEEAHQNAKIEIEKQVQTDKASLMTVFGLFASITAFLTIEFQFLKTIASFHKLLGFTFILCGLLLSFNIALDHLIKSRLDKETPKPTYSFVLFVGVLLIVGVGFTFIGNEADSILLQEKQNSLIKRKV